MANQHFTLWRTRLRGLALALLGMALGTCVADATAASLDQAFLDGLRQRRLFALAEQFCQSQLARTTLTSRERAELTIEYSRTLVEHALQLSGEKREPLWKQAREVVESWDRNEPKHPCLVLVQTQAALVELAQGELARQEAELLGNRGADVEQARALLRDAVARFDRVSQQIDEQLRERNLQPRVAPEWLTAAELLQLQKHVARHRARALRQQGESFAAASPDRIAALTRAVEVLAPLVGLDASDPLGLASRLEEIACLRLLGDRPAAARRLAAFDALEPPPPARLQARAETVRLLLEARQIVQAQELVATTTELDDAPADWDYAVLEAAVAAWLAAAQESRDDEKKRWQQLAASQIQRLDQRHGPYWSRRAEMLLAAHVSGGSLSGDLDILRRSADSLYRAGQLEPALKAYDELVRQALAAKQPQAAFAAALTAAAIEQSREQHASAASRFQQAALLAPEHPQAREAHLAAIWNLAKAAPQPSAEQTAQYQQWLVEHLARWPSGPSADQVRHWLGQLHEGRREWSAAIDAYRAIDPSAALAGAALEALARVYFAWLTELRQSQQPYENTASAAATFFEQRLKRGTQPWPDQWTDAERRSALYAAQFWLDDALRRADRAEPLLTAALNHATGAPAEWLEQAQLLAVQARVARGQVAAARELAQQITGADPERLVQLLAALQQHAAALPNEARAAIGQLTLDLGQARDAKLPLSADQQRRFELAKGQALAAVGRRDAALEQLAALSRAYPQDAVVQESYAAALSAGTTPTDQQRALEQWREIERRSKPGSERWFRAKLRLAQAHLALGHRERAKQIVELTQLLHPELGGAATKTEFLAVLKQCQ